MTFFQSVLKTGMTIVTGVISIAIIVGIFYGGYRLGVAAVDFVAGTL